MNRKFGINPTKNEKNLEKNSNKDAIDCFQQRSEVRKIYVELTFVLKFVSNVLGSPHPHFYSPNIRGRENIVEF